MAHLKQCCNIVSTRIRKRGRKEILWPWYKKMYLITKSFRRGELKWIESWVVFDCCCRKVACWFFSSPNYSYPSRVYNDYEGRLCGSTSAVWLRRFPSRSRTICSLRLHHRLPMVSSHMKRQPPEMRMIRIRLKSTGHRPHCLLIFQRMFLPSAPLRLFSFSIFVDILN